MYVGRREGLAFDRPDMDADGVDLAMGRRARHA
jgi:hypothetical protein